MTYKIQRRGFYSSNVIKRILIRILFPYLRHQLVGVLLLPVERLPGCYDDPGSLADGEHARGGQNPELEVLVELAAEGLHEDHLFHGPVVLLDSRVVLVLAEPEAGPGQLFCVDVNCGAR